MSPRGLTKDRRALLERLQPDERGLFLALRRQITPDMLETIASADYGTDYDTHLGRLKRLSEAEAFDEPLEWEPKEVLELAGWAPANYTGDGRPVTGERGRLVQAFAALCLLRAYGHSANQDHLSGMNQRLVILLDCLDELDTAYTEATTGFVAWLTLKLPDFDDETAFYLVALISLLLDQRFQAGQPAHSNQASADGFEADILALALWAIEAEEEIYSGWGHGVGDYPQTWLLRTTHFAIGGKRWMKRAKRLRLHQDALQSQNTRERLTWVADALSAK